ncbi:MAG: hypothetical protein ACXWIU_11460, partial [Limisphaerales bacterium]
HPKQEIPMADLITNQAAALQITPFVDKFLIERDKNVDGQISFKEFLGQVQNTPTGTGDAANNTPTSTSTTPIANQPGDLQSVLNDLHY